MSVSSTQTEDHLPTEPTEPLHSLNSELVYFLFYSQKPKAAVPSLFLCHGLVSGETMFSQTGLENKVHTKKQLIKLQTPAEEASDGFISVCGQVLVCGSVVGEHCPKNTFEEHPFIYS